MGLTIKQKQDKAKRDQKILAAGMAGLAVIFGYMANSTGFLVVALVYAAVVICVIFTELIDETWVAARFIEMMNSAPEEPKPATIDVIS